MRQAGKRIAVFLGVLFLLLLTLSGPDAVSHLTDPEGVAQKCPIYHWTLASSLLFSSADQVFTPLFVEEQLCLPPEILLHPICWRNPLQRSPPR